MDTTKIKILVSGDVNGHYKQLFNRVETINKKSGPFEILLCVGEFFGSNNDELIAYRNGYKNVPIPTYILGPIQKDCVQCYENIENEICPNLTYLGKRGLYTLSSGIKIAYLSGLEGSDSNMCTFNIDDVTAVKNSSWVSKVSLTDYKGVDILITSQWPQGILEEVKNGSRLISYLVKEIRPRYHFCGLNKMYHEPAPFRIHSDCTTQLELATRFIALADVGNSKKDKYIYALNIASVEKMRLIDLVQKTTNEIPCPFDQLDFSNLKTTKIVESGAQYFYDLSKKENNKNKNKRGGGGDHEMKRARPTFDQEKCWFCLSSANVEKHLVISIGNNFYIALAKGPINNYHILILSITHILCTALLSSEDWNELENFKTSIKNFYKKIGKATCFFERQYKSSHLQVNAIGIDEGLEWKIQHSFEDKGEEYKIHLETLPALTDPSQLPQQGAYFVAELPNNTTLLTRQMKRFPLHFAREVFCSENLLNCDEKIDWRECTLSKDEEISFVTQFREDYKPFDVTL